MGMHCTSVPAHIVHLKYPDSKTILYQCQSKQTLIFSTVISLFSFFLQCNHGCFTESFLNDISGIFRSNLSGLITWRTIQFREVSTWNCSPDIYNHKAAVSRRPVDKSLRSILTIKSSKSILVADIKGIDAPGGSITSTIPVK